MLWALLLCLLAVPLLAGCKKKQQDPANMRATPMPCNKATKTSTTEKTEQKETKKEAADGPEKKEDGKGTALTFQPVEESEEAQHTDLQSTDEAEPNPLLNKEIRDKLTKKKEQKPPPPPLSQYMEVKEKTAQTATSRDASVCKPAVKTAATTLRAEPSAMKPSAWKTPKTTDTAMTRSEMPTAIQRQNKSEAECTLEGNGNPKPVGKSTSKAPKEQDKEQKVAGTSSTQKTTKSQVSPAAVLPSVLDSPNNTKIPGATGT